MDFIFGIGFILAGIIGWAAGWNHRGFVEKKKADSALDEYLTGLKEDYVERCRDSQLEKKYNDFVNSLWDEYGRGE